MASLAEAKPKIFLSYARADDEAFIQRLQSDLIRAGVEVWWDRAVMESRGRTFLQEIRDAIEGVDRIIAVVGPKAISSEYVRYEWDHALLFAKGIVPILRLGTYELVPLELLGENAEGLAAVDFAKLHCPDCRTERPYGDALAEIVRILRHPMPPLGACYAPALPPHLLPRRDYILRLQDSVLADVQRPTVITSAGQVSALQGMGGIGKSVLAAAFAHAIATRRAFPDGIIWLSGGPGATNLTRLGNMRQAGQVLGDDPGRYVEEPTAKLNLAKLLEGKICLMVLDDVWSMDQVEAFRDALGPRCRLLITTRDAGLVTALGARRHEVDTLSDDQALTLVAEWSGIPRASLPPEAQTIAVECGNLPLALSLCGALLRDNPDRWANILHRLRNADLSKIRQQLPNYPYPDVFRAVQVSVDTLTREERAGYLQLAVFPENTSIPGSNCNILADRYFRCTRPHRPLRPSRVVATPRPEPGPASPLANGLRAELLPRPPYTPCHSHQRLSCRGSLWLAERTRRRLLLPASAAAPGRRRSAGRVEGTPLRLRLADCEASCHEHHGRPRRLRSDRQCIGDCSDCTGSAAGDPGPPPRLLTIARSIARAAAGRQYSGSEDFDGGSAERSGTGMAMSTIFFTHTTRRADGTDFGRAQGPDQRAGNPGRRQPRHLQLL
jgi:hypothetical protein